MRLYSFFHLRSNFYFKICFFPLDYYVGSMEGFSKIFYFQSMPAGEDWGPSIVAYGDMGSANAQSLPRLLVDAAQGMYDAVVHVGKF